MSGHAFQILESGQPCTSIWTKSGPSLDQIWNWEKTVWTNFGNHPLVLIQDAPNLSPTIFELGTPFKVQTWPYGYCLACPSRVLDYIDMRGRPGSVMVFIGPGLLVLKQDGSNSYVECTGKSRRNLEVKGISLNLLNSV